MSTIKIRARENNGSVTVKALIKHPMETGQRKNRKTGDLIPSQYIQEVKARGGKVIIITDNNGAKQARKQSDQVIILPNTNLLTSPILYSLPVQLIAYYLAVLLGTDVDQPRNLAKSVTVE